MNMLEEKAKEFDNLHPLQKIRAVAALKDGEEEDKKLDGIHKDFSTRNYSLLDVYNVADKYQIVKVISTFSGNRKGEIGYHVYVDYKRISRVEYSFDDALLTAISYRYNCESAKMWISKMLGINSEPEFEE